MRMTVIVAVLLSISACGVGQNTVEKPQACWLETSNAILDGAMGGAGIRETRVWDSTVSGVLVRHPKGDVLIDTGFSPNAEAQMNELPPASRAFGLQIVSSAKDRKSILDVLKSANEPPTQIARIIMTHTHYDHLGGATQLTAPIYVASAEAKWMMEQEAHPTITPPSLVRAIEPRIRILAYDSGPYLGFSESKDIYNDGTIVVVPLPGHTPGSQGIFLKLGKGRVFLIGDAADTLEAAERGLPKSSLIRANTDFEPELADETTRRVAAFHLAHPEIALVPAHDRVAYAAVFGNPSNCISNFQATKEDYMADQNEVLGKAPSPVIEIVTLKLKPGVTDTQFALLDKKVQTTYMEKRPGFLSRESAPGSNNDWVVIVHWKSIADADASMKSFSTAPATAEWMSMIVPNSMVMTRYGW